MPADGKRLRDVAAAVAVAVEQPSGDARTH
jgi:hypothetical protein